MTTKMTPAQLTHFLTYVEKNLPKEMARRKADPVGQNVAVYLHEKDMYGKPIRLHGKVAAQDTSGLTFEGDGGSVFIPLSGIQWVEWPVSPEDREKAKPPS